MKLCKRLLIITLVSGLLLCLPACKASGQEEASSGAVTHYSYPITPESEDWFDYSVLAKVEMLRIPEETLKNMTDEALVAAIAEYPYLLDIGLYGNCYEDGIEVCRTYFSALDELLNRDTAQEALKTYGVRIVEEYADPSQKGDVAVCTIMADLINCICKDICVHTDYDKATGTYLVSVTEAE